MKNFKSIIALTLAVVMMLGSGSTAFAMDQNINNDSNQETNVAIQEVLTEYKEISRDEFLKNYAEQKGITIEQADKIDQINTLNDIKKESSKLSINSLVSPMASSETVYAQVTKTFNTGSSGTFWSQIVTVIQVKMQKYYTSSEAYQKFTEVLSIGADAYGSGLSTWTTIAQSASITNDTSKSNSIYMMLSGNVEIGISASMETSAEAAGFSLGYSIGTTYYFRKFVQANYTFNSNYPL